jgi:hypothetical protein
MAITNTFISTTDPTTVFTAVGQQAITVMYICNTGDQDAVVNVFCVDSSDSSGPGDSSMIYNQLLITSGNSGSGDTYVISTEKLILDNNDFIDVEANVANVIAVTVSSISV